MIIAVFPVLVAVIGVLLYVLASNTKVAEIGRILFFVGMLWVTYSLTTKTVKLGAIDTPTQPVAASLA